MEAELLLLTVAVCGAAALQSATGIGFGVIGGPILLLIIDQRSAIQVSILLNLLIAVLLAPSLWKHCDRRVLGRLLSGLAIGSPAGVLIYLNADLALLKILAGVAVLLTLFLFLRGTVVQAVRANGPGLAAAGFAAGVMGASLAMPGPVPAGWLAANGYGKATVRATVLVMFVFAYTVALALQAGIAGIDAATWRQSALLAPATIPGILLGHFLGHRISERHYRRLIATVLAITALLLFLSGD